MFAFLRNFMSTPVGSFAVSSYTVTCKELVGNLLTRCARLLVLLLHSYPLKLFHICTVRIDGTDASNTAYRYHKLLLRGLVRRLSPSLLRWALLGRALRRCRWMLPWQRSCRWP
ncbi:unnamed protein product [Prorocentrum cordatum]|uniref:Secreted protein n=1 Tax=Prorocentrum cordatum TaxID=2364126 RepID=A0ABN9T0D2_9DINO|nr:unnamed protein product [Polarella glacialis]